MANEKAGKPDRGAPEAGGPGPEGADAKADSGAAEGAAGGDAARALTQRTTENIARIEALSQRLVAALATKRKVPPALQVPGQDLYLRTAAAMTAEMMTNPAKLIEHQVGWWGKALAHYAEVQAQLAKGSVAPPEDKGPRDRRFANPLWDEHPWFNFVKRQYLLQAEAIEGAVADLSHLEPRDARRVAYFSRQILDMMAPTNFLATNPDALARAVETEGQSLVDGLENLVRDIEAGGGELQVSLADRDAFKVGENLATTPGKVVFRDRLFELIQYAPTTAEVHRRPLVIFPPWINKFYVLDLKEKNSLIRWVVDQGYTLFVVSWANPDASYADVGMDDYVESGILRAVAEVKAITGEKSVNAVGYCIAGTTLALALALMAQRGDGSVNAATFLTTLTDFSDQGEVGVFLDEDFVGGIEAEVTRAGCLDSFYMSRTFSFLRANDLIYQPAIRNYMMGQAPPAFDLLYWNGDGTNLPARMAVEYLRGLCQNDLFATEGFPICGTRVKIGEVSTPLFAVACETDHIAAWKSSFRGMAKTGGDDRTFVLSQSGHIAGIVNPPSKKKYGHYTGGDWSGTPDDWRAAADFHEGSWWPRWGGWLAPRSGAKVPARVPGEGRETFGDAPGRYVVAEPAL